MRVRIVALLVILALLVLAALTVELPDVQALRTWVLGLGPLAPLVFWAGYVLAVPMPLPKSVLSAVAGVAFGIAWGLPLALAGATAGAVLSYAIARLLGRDVVDRFAHDHLVRVDAVVRRRGALAALLVRLVPLLPFTVLNYACGVTAMRLRHYVLGTALGVVPGTTTLVVLAATGATVSLWVPAIISVSLAVLSLIAAMVWSHRTRTARAATGR